MKRHSPFVSAFVLACGLGLGLVASGCRAEIEEGAEPGSEADFADEKPVALRANGGAKKLPQAFSNEVAVLDDSLLVPSNAGTRVVLDELRAGMVIAGNRDVSTPDLRTSKNPSGYLRRVVSLRAAGDNVEIRTARAYLNELIEVGDLRFSSTSPSPSIFDDAPSVAPGVGFRGPDTPSVGSGETPANVTLEGPTGNVKFAPVVKVANAKFAIGAKVEGRIQLRRAAGVPYGVQRASLRVDLDPTLGADVEYGARVTSAQSQLGGTLNETWQGPSVPIPIGGPIPLTIRLRPEVSCKVTLQGEVTLTSHVELAGHAAAAFEYLGGTDVRANPDPPRLTAKHQFVGVRGKAGVEGECAIQGVVSLLAFDAVGIEAKLGPFARVTAEACVTSAPSGGFVVFETHGLRADAQARIQIPGLGTPLVQKPLFVLTPTKSEPLYFVGNADTCVVR